MRLLTSLHLCIAHTPYTSVAVQHFHVQHPGQARVSCPTWYTWWLCTLAGALLLIMPSQRPCRMGKVKCSCCTHHNPATVGKVGVLRRQSLTHPVSSQPLFKRTSRHLLLARCSPSLIRDRLHSVRPCRLSCLPCHSIRRAAKLPSTDQGRATGPPGRHVHQERCSEAATEVRAVQHAMVPHRQQHGACVDGHRRDSNQWLLADEHDQAGEDASRPCREVSPDTVPCPLCMLPLYRYPTIRHRHEHPSAAATDAESGLPPPSLGLPAPWGVPFPPCLRCHYCTRKHQRLGCGITSDVSTLNTCSFTAVSCVHSSPPAMCTGTCAPSFWHEQVKLPAKYPEDLMQLAWDRLAEEVSVVRS